MFSLSKSFDNSILCGKSTNMLAAFDAAIEKESCSRPEDTERQFNKRLSEFAGNNTVLSAFENAINQNYQAEKKAASSGFSVYQNPAALKAFEKALNSAR